MVQKIRLLTAQLSAPFFRIKQHIYVMDNRLA